MKTMLISFEADWFKRLEAGHLFYEYRKNFPAEPMAAYFYVSSPAKYISGYAEFGNRESLSSWLDKYKDAPAAVERINDYLTDCRYAIPILKFQPTNRIPLTELKKVPGFVVPRMYYFLEDSPLLDYLRENLHPTAAPIIKDFSGLTENDICN